MESGINFAWPVTAINKVTYELTLDFHENVLRKMKEQELVLFGAGIRGTEIATILRSFGVERFIFVDNNPEKWGGNIDGIAIYPPTRLQESKGKSLVLITTEESSGMISQLEELGYKQDLHFFLLINNHYKNFVDEFHKSGTRDLLVMGDCMFETISFDDDARVSLAERIIEEAGELETSVMAIHGMNLTAFYQIYRLLSCRNKLPDFFCIMLNFETLTGKQHLLPRSQHHELMCMIEESLEEIDDVFSEYVQLTRKRVERVSAELFTNSVNNINQTGKISKQAAKLFLKLYYLYDLDITIEPIKALENIFEIAKENQVTVVPFVPPVNYILAEELFPDQFQEGYNGNLSKLKLLVEENGFQLLDLSHIALPEDFSHATSPDETLNEKGRKKVAKAILNEVKNLKERKDGGIS